MLLLWCGPIAVFASTDVYDRSYDYDGIGNIIYKSDQGDYEYSQPGKTSPQAVTEIDDGNGNTKLFEYDANGNLVLETITSATGTITKELFWDHKNRLIKVIVTDESGEMTTVEYLYSFSGQRLKKTVTTSQGSQKTVYPFADYEVTADGHEKTSIYAGNVHVATHEKDDAGQEQVYYHYNDHLGGSNIVADENGELVQLILYYPYGSLQLNRQEGEYDTRQKYTGHELDEEIDLYYAKARYYDSDVGRFVSVDPLVLVNLVKQDYYAYATNNPLVFVDPLGLRATTEHETKVALKIHNLWSQSVDNDETQSSEMYKKAYNTYVTTIKDLPEGGDPKSFTIMNDAIFKWYDSQMGYDNSNWLSTTPTKSDYYSDLPSGESTCSAFVGEVLADSIGYKNYKRGERDGELVVFPPNTDDWITSNVNGFNIVGEGQYGDVITFKNNYIGDWRTPIFGYGHTGIYFGNGIYISANTGSPDSFQSGKGVVLKYVPEHNNIIYNR